MWLREIGRSRLVLLFMAEALKHTETKPGFVLIFFFWGGGQYIKIMKVFGNWGNINDHVPI